MGNLPLERLKPSTPFSFVMLDLFGPFPIRGEVQKRTTGKASGITFTELVSRSVHIEVSFAYDTASFMQALLRFSIRNWPIKIFSDPGSLLVHTSKELREIRTEVNR